MMTRVEAEVSATNLAAALRDLATALATPGRERSRDARMRAARQVLVRHCVALLGIEPRDQLSVAEIVRLANEAPARPARRSCAVLMVHALAMPGLVPPGSFGTICALVEGALHHVLLRCGYPFGGPIEQKMHVLERLHATIGELMLPLEPTFPNWQGLYAG
jgi:hypothetical protein